MFWHVISLRQLNGWLTSMYTYLFNVIHFHFNFTIFHNILTC